MKDRRCPYRWVDPPAAVEPDVVERIGVPERVAALLPRRDEAPKTEASEGALELEADDLAIETESEGLIVNTADGAFDVRADGKALLDEPGCAEVEAVLGTNVEDGPVLVVAGA